MASTFNALPIIGIDYELRTSTPDFALGTPSIGNKSDTWVYVLSSGTVAVGTCTVSGSGGFIVTDAAGNYTADTAFADAEYGWVRLTDSPLINPD